MIDSFILLTEFFELAISKDYVYVFWEKVNLKNIDWDLEKYLEKILYENR